MFVEIALTHGLADHLPELLNRADAVDDPDTAIFYSITSAQPGLAGVHLGNELIKQVVDALRHENDHLKTFATLSPLPGFRAWFVTQVEQGALDARGGGGARSRRRRDRRAHRPHVDRRPDARRAGATGAAVRSARATSAPCATAGRSTRSRTSTCRTARRSNASTGWRTRRRTASRSRSGSWSTTATTGRRSPANAGAYLADGCDQHLVAGAQPGQDHQAVGSSRVTGSGGPGWFRTDPSRMT